MHDGYTQTYFAKISEASRSSAAVVVPIVMELLQPDSVVDVGCGVGAWAAEFKRQGVAEIVGVDGPYLSPEDLDILPSEFVSSDLTSPLKFQRKFSLAVSLEVAEHLPAGSSEEFVATLTQLAPAVLFSAAVPHQGGEDHLNEQWPLYWASRFASRGYTAFDVIRRRVWNEPSVQWWYAQNMFLFATGEVKDQLHYAGQLANSPDELLPLVHPGNYEQTAWRKRVLETVVDLTAIVPHGSEILLADNNLFGKFPLPHCNVRPFTEVEGQYAGPPADDFAAIAELSRQIARGAQYMVFGWPAFWHLETYREFSRLLRTKATLLLEDDRLIVFKLPVRI